MGYTTDFEGIFKLDRPLRNEHAAYLLKFAETRRMKRDMAKCATRPDPLREAVRHPVGFDGEYFVGEGGTYGQGRGDDVVDYNIPPSGQPSLWCQWAPQCTDTDGIFDAIGWDGGEKFYNYVEWLEYFIEHFIRPWDYTLNGEVEWQGEDPDDFGIIVVKDNVVHVREGQRSFAPLSDDGAEGPSPMVAMEEPMGPFGSSISYDLANPSFKVIRMSTLVVGAVQDRGNGSCAAWSVTGASFHGIDEATAVDMVINDVEQAQRKLLEKRS